MESEMVACWVCLPSEFGASKFASNGGPKKAEALSDNLLLQNIQDNKIEI